MGISFLAPGRQVPAVELMVAPACHIFDTTMILTTGPAAGSVEWDIVRYSCPARSLYGTVAGKVTAAIFSSIVEFGLVRH